MEQVWCFFDFLDSNEEGKKYLECVNILKKPILNNKLEKRVEEVKKAKEAQEAQVVKEVREVRLHLEVKEIFQNVEEVVRAKLELEQAKIRVLQNKEVPSSISMHAMAKGIKVLQNLVLSERKTNVQLTLQLWKAQKEKGGWLNEEATKAMKTQMLDPCTKKDIKAKNG